MRNRNKIKVEILLIILLFSFLGTVSYLGDYYPSGLVAENVINSPKENVSIIEVEGSRLDFIPENPVAGLIFYPGAKVEYKAYAPMMEKLAENGILCVLIRMPSNMAFFDIDAAEAVRDEYPKITEWYLCGHSLGGAMAASYISEHFDEYKGLILLASYSTKDLSQSGLDVLCVYGTEDEVLNRTSYQKNLSNLPSDYKELIIEGGCHAYFADYGAQKGDGKPAITLDEQIKITVDNILEFIK